ncbi:DUF86 domain-containing protein [Myxococcota bacterium]|nr:DUF86 domain-containing protein [Myxococcota bacterium]
MADRARIDARLDRIEEYCRRLDEVARVPWEDLSHDPTSLAAMERWLEVAVQAAIDAGGRVAALAGWPMPETYRDVFRLLAGRSVLPAELGRRLGEAAGLRNLLVHDYLDVDDTLLHRGLAEDVRDLREFCGWVQRWLDASGAPPGAPAP